MTNPYLIAHIVRGEPAFDIAERVECPICIGIGEAIREEGGVFRCDDCDGEGFFWIIPTSGHRAYPYWFCLLSTLGYSMQPDGSVPDLIFPVPSGWPDHYAINNRAFAPASLDDNRTILERLGLVRPKQKVERRF